MFAEIEPRRDHDWSRRGFLFSVEGAKMKSQTVDDFCTAHGISRGLFYQLVKRGEAPKTFKIGRCTRISETAAVDWVASREAIAA
jgi:predicted DNA-binding transcriptional regulator AlpA